MRSLAASLVRFRPTDDVVGINRRNVDLVYANNERRNFPYADDKLLAKRAMRSHGVPVPETLAVCRGLFEVEATLDSLDSLSSFVVKPASGSGGDGILVVAEKLDDTTWRSAGGSIVTRERLRKHLADIVFGAYSKQLEDAAFVEPLIVAHPTLASLWPGGLCDVRVIVLRGTPVMAMLRVPTRESGGRANLHQGGLGLAVDLESGRVVRAYHRGASIERHPESGAALLGIVVPSFEEVVSVACRAAESVPLGYLGVDVVIDDSGLVYVLEINARPGLEIQNVHGVGLAAMVARTGEDVTPPKRRDPDGSGAGPKAVGGPRRPTGDRLLPVLAVFTAVLAGCIALEVAARRREPTPLIVAIASAGDTTSSDDDTTPEGEAPTEVRPLSAEHAQARILAHRGEIPDAIVAFQHVATSDPDDDDVRVELAYWMIVGDRAADARDVLASIASEHANDPRVALYLGHALAALDDRPGAERAYRQALRLRRGYAGAAIALARLLVRERRFDEAIAVVDPSTNSGGNDERARALVVYGAASILAGRRDPAIRAFERAIERAPAHAELRIRIGRAWLESNATSDAARAIEAFESAARIAPDLPTAYSGLGRAYEKSGDDLEAARAYERCLALDPAYTYARRRLLRIALAARDFRRAEGHAARLLTEDDGNPEHHFLAGLVAAREGRADDARARYLTAIERAHDDYPEAYFNLGQLENRAQHRDAAIAAYEKAIAERPRYTQAMNNLGLVLDSVGRVDEAEATFRRAIAIDPRYGAALLNLGTLLSRLGRHDEAITTLERALGARNGRHPPTEVELARALERAGRNADAITRLTALAAREPRLASVSMALGETLQRSGDAGAAKAAFAHAFELDPESAEAEAALGRVEAELGDLVSARAHLSGSLDLESTSTSTRLALADVLRLSRDPTGCQRESDVVAADPAHIEEARAMRARCPNAHR